MAYPERLTEQVQRNESGLRQPGKAAGIAGVTPELIKVLAAQQVLEQQKVAENKIRADLETNPKNIREQQQEALNINAENSLQNKLADVRGALQHQEGQRRQRLAQVGQGATPPPNVAGTGIAPARPQTMQMAQGGIVGFQRGREVDPEAAEKMLAASAGLSLTDFKKLPIAEQERHRKNFVAQAPSKTQGPPRKPIKGEGFGIPLLKRQMAAEREIRGQVKPGQYIPERAVATSTPEVKSAVSGPPTNVPMQPGIAQGLGVTGPTGPGRGNLFGPTPDKRASLPPLVESDPLAVANYRGERIKPEDFTKNIKLPGASTSIWGTGKDGKSQIPQTPLNRPQRDLLIGGARGLAGTSPAARYEQTRERAQALQGISAAHHANEEKRQADVRGLDAQLGDPDRTRQASAMDYIRGLAVNPTSGGMIAQAAGDRAREQGLRARLKDRQTQERTWETTERQVGKDIHDTAEAAYNKAQDMVVKGYEILSQVDSEDRATMTANTRALLDAKIADRQSEDHRIQVTLYAALDLADKGMQGAIANQVQKTAEVRLKLEAVKIKLQEGRLDKKDLQTAIEDAEKNMQVSHREILDLFLQRQIALEQQYGTDPKKLDEMLKAMHKNKKAQLSLIIGPIAVRINGLQDLWDAKQVTAVRQIKP
jgi:F0F1-type ATP synthase epsilon subunit